MDGACASSWWSTIPGDCGVGHVDNSTRGPVEHRGCSGLCQVSPPGLVAWAARASAGPSLGAQLGTVVSRSTQPHDSEVSGIRACWGALKSELQRELVKLKEWSTRAESDTSRGEEGSFWLNTEFGVAHGQQCILDGCSPRLFRARCGWQARESDAVVCTDVLLASHKSLNGRCFPYLREQRRSRLMSRSLMQEV